MQKQLLAAAVLIAAGAALAQAAPAASAPTAVRVRGTIQSATPSLLTVKSKSGTLVRVRLAPKVPVLGVVPSSRAQSKNSFSGIASVTPAERHAEGAGSRRVP